MSDNKTHRIGIHSEDVLVECRINSDNVPHLMINLELQRGHRCVEVNFVQIAHQQDLTVTFPSIAGFRPLSRFADFHYNDVPRQKVRARGFR